MRNDKVLEIPKRTETTIGEQLLLRCGDVVPQSGIYEVVHHRQHAGTEGSTMVAVRGELLQRCKICGEAVKFRLVYAAPHLSEDPDFEPGERQRK